MTRLLKYENALGSNLASASRRQDNYKRRKVHILTATQFLSKSPVGQFRYQKTHTYAKGVKIKLH